MGCHTWFYKKIDVTYDTAKKSLIKSLNEDIETLTRWRDNPTGDDLAFLKQYYVDFTWDSLNNDIDIRKRKLKFVEGGYCKVAVMNKYADGLSIIHYEKERGHFKAIREYHDIFRIGNYPKDKLFSLEETLEFIEKNRDNIHFCNDDYKQYLENFWKDHPYGMIDFG